MVDTGSVEFDRRLRQCEERIQWLDEHGTRGVAALQVQMSNMQRDMGKLESTMEQVSKQFDQQVQRSQSIGWSRVLAFAAILVPLYGLVITLMVHATLP